MASVAPGLVVFLAGYQHGLFSFSNRNETEEKVEDEESADPEKTTGKKTWGAAKKPGKNLAPGPLPLACLM